MIPPLKDFPEEIESDDSIDSDRTEVAIARATLLKETKEFKERGQWEDNLFVRMKDTFIKLAELKPNKDPASKILGF